jgi:hypothetical protein
LEEFKTVTSILTLITYTVDNGEASSATSTLFKKRFLKETSQNANFFIKSIAYDVKVKGKCEI